MNIRPSINQKQFLSFQLNPKLIQMFNIYHSSYSDLISQIKTEQDQNVFIEVTQEDSLLSYSASNSSASSPRQSSQDVDFTEFTASANYRSLTDYALSQINYIHINSSQKKILESLIHNLDEKGFIQNYSHLKSKLKTKYGTSSVSVDSMLKVLQQFEPEGIGARSLEECLLIQLDQFELENEKLKDVLTKVITHHLHDLAEQNISSIASSCNIPEDGVASIAEFIKQNLNPNPAAGFVTESSSPVIVPSFEINFSNNTLKIVNLEEEKGIKIAISDHYQTLLQDPNTDEKTRVFLKEKLAKAKELATFLTQRREMLTKLVTYICESQLLYFKKGSDFLIPLLQKDVASHLTLSPSSVSRILSYKYCRTPYGVIPLKVLCPRNYFGKTKDQFKHHLRYFLETYPTLSDQKITFLLKDHGISIARRTVAKYRKELGLNSSFFHRRVSNKALPTQDQ